MQTNTFPGCLGQLQWTIGGALHELTFDGPFTCNVDQRVSKIHDLICEIYADIGTKNRIASFTLGMFNNPGRFACLSSKAAEARDLVPVMARLCRKVHNGSTRDEHRCRVFELLEEIYDVFSLAGLVLSDLEHRTVVEAYDTFLLHYNALLRISLANGYRNYNWVFKTHHCYHIMELSNFLNPLVIWCYEFEAHVPFGQCNQK